MTDPFAPPDPQPQPRPVSPSGGSSPLPYPDGSTPWTPDYGAQVPQASSPYPPAPGSSYPPQPGSPYPPGSPYTPQPGGPYPPGPGSPYGSQPGPWSGQTPPQQGTDGLAIAALVTGILQTGPVALVLGIIGLRRVTRSGRDGKGMAIAGMVLGALTTVVGAIFAVFLIIGAVSFFSSDDSYGDSPRLDRLWDACEVGDMGACDDLYRQSPLDSEYEEFGHTCGNRTSGGGWCVDVESHGTAEGDPDTYGDDAALDRLWDACEAGDMGACDDLYEDAPLHSEYEDFGDTCGDRTAGGLWAWCDTDDDDPATADDASGDTYGDNPELDALWDACEAGDMGACDDLYMESEFGSEYEEFGDTCGGRTEGGPYCTELED